VKLPKILRSQSARGLLIAIIVTLQILFFSSWQPAHSQVVEVVAILKLVAKTGVARGTCFTGAYMGGNECRKPSRCVEAIEHFENVVNSNGSSASVRSLESWIGSASQNENCAVAIAGGPIISAARNAVFILNEEAKKNPNIISGSESGSKALVNAGGKCLDVDAPNIRNNGGKVQVWDCTGQPQQQWSFRGNALVNGGGKCLDVDAPNMSNNGGKVQVWDCNEQSQQQWRF
jgi:hypothetical protein